MRELIWVFLLMMLTVLVPSSAWNHHVVIRATGTHPSTRQTKLILNAGAGEGDDFWTQQKTLMREMTDQAENSLKKEQMGKFAKRRNALISDTALFTTLICCCIWAFSVNPFISLSYAFGAACGLAYAYGLGKYVETLGGSTDDTEVIQGAGVGQARFAFLLLLVLFVGKFRSYGLSEIPSIAGFFTYQLASLSQGLREFND